jgi:hypothetical protein
MSGRGECVLIRVGIVFVVSEIGCTVDSLVGARGVDKGRCLGRNDGREEGKRGFADEELAKFVLFRGFGCWSAIWGFNGDDICGDIGGLFLEFRIGFIERAVPIWYRCRNGKLRFRGWSTKVISDRRVTRNRRN